MSKNPPAFPRTGEGLGNSKYDEPGMTLRDYFAAKALQGLLANPKMRDEIIKNGGALSGWIEESAFAFADAMLEQREGGITP